MSPSRSRGLSVPLNIPSHYMSPRSSRLDRGLDKGSSCEQLDSKRQLPPTGVGRNSHIYYLNTPPHIPLPPPPPSSDQEVIYDEPVPRFDGVSHPPEVPPPPPPERPVQMERRLITGRSMDEPEPLPDEDDYEKMEPIGHISFSSATL